MIGEEILRACDRQSNETVTLRKHVTKYMDGRISKIWESHGDKIIRVNSILIT